jgi:hypothetical protein
MDMEHWWNKSDRIAPTNFRDAVPVGTSSTANPTCIGLLSKPDFRDWKSTPDRLFNDPVR